MPITESINSLFKSSSFQGKIRAIAKMAESELQQAVKVNIYDKYTPVSYIRTYDLLNSVTSDVRMTPDGVQILVYFDSEKMNHWTIYGWDEHGYNLDEGDYIDDLLPILLNEGFEWDTYTGDYTKNTSYYMFKYRPASHFFEKARNQINRDLKTRIQEAFTVEVRKIFK